MQAVGVQSLQAESLAEACELAKGVPTLDGLILDEVAVSAAVNPSRSIAELRGVVGGQTPTVFLSALKSNLDAIADSAIADSVIILWKPVKQAALYQAIRSIRSTTLRSTTLSAAPKPLISQTATLPHASLTILIAEDNRTNQRVALRLLEILGYSADLASTGIEVLAALEQQRYDVILMDMRMPKMDGVETTRRIRQQPQHQDTWIIAMTANALDSDRKLCLSAGMDDYLRKPIKREALSKALGRSPALQQMALD